MLGPFSATKSSSNFFDKTYVSKAKVFQQTLKPDMTQFYRKDSGTPKGFFSDKQNILRRAEE